MYHHQDAGGGREVPGHLAGGLPGPGQLNSGRRADLPVAERELDAHLQRTVRRTSYMRQGFYVVVLLVALAGQVSGAVEALHIPLAAAIPAVGALELGGIVVLANSDVRRRLGERAVASRLLSVAIAAGAVTFNWLAHANHLLGGFFAGMSALGYLVWLMHTENQRRDRLRAKGDLPPTTPAYEVVEHWLRHPWLTRRAKSLAKANPELGLYDSLAAARAEVRRERRQAAISKVLHRKIRAAVDPTTADIAVAVYDLDEIAIRLANGADYDGLTSLIAADLAPARLAANTAGAANPADTANAIAPTGTAPARIEATVGEPRAAGAAEGGPATGDSTSVLPEAVRRQIEAAVPSRPAAGPVEDPAPVLPPALRRDIEDRLARGRQSVPAARSGADVSLADTDAYPVVIPRLRPAEPTPPAPAVAPQPPTAQPTDVMSPSPVPAQASPADEPRRRDRDRRTVAVSHGDLAAPAPAEPARGTVRGGSLRGRVHALLDAHVPDGDQRDNSSLVDFAVEALELSEIERLTASNYVRSWKRDADAGRRAPATSAASRAPAP
jgi:hypothetical protein